MIVASIYAPRFEAWDGCDYDRLLRLLDASCRRLGLRHVVISDSERPGLETAVYNLPEALMPLLLEGQRLFIRDAREPVLLVGADCLVTRDPRQYLQGDLTVTLGPFRDCVMNTGAIWVGDGPRCADVWAKALALGPVSWGEDQLCLWAAIQTSGLDWWRVAAEKHNWAPEGLEDDAGMPTVVHFRGPRKAYMEAWAEKWLGVRIDG